jgi:hypothetical protein
MDTSPIVAFVAACTLVAACESQPDVVFVADGDDFDVLSLTDAQDGCDAPGRLGYLTWWDGATVRGCWVRDRSHIVVRFIELEDRRVPVSDFRPTELAAERHMTLD